MSVVDAARERTLAATITAYWAARGYRVSTTVESAGLDNFGHALQAVRSDMINGLPRGLKTAGNLTVAVR